MAIFTPMIKASKKDVVALDLIYFIFYPILFKKNKVLFQFLFDFSSEVNTITLGYALKLGLKVFFTNVGVQKIDGFIFKIFKIVLASFQVKNKLESARFF